MNTFLEQTEFYSSISWQVIIRLMGEFQEWVNKQSHKQIVACKKHSTRQKWEATSRKQANHNTH